MFGGGFKLQNKQALTFKQSYGKGTVMRFKQSNGTFIVNVLR